MATDGAWKLLSIKELRDRTGFSVSTLRRRVKDGTLAKFQPGGPRTRMAFHPDALDQTPPQDPEPSQQPTHTVAASEEATDKLSGPRPKWKALYPRS